MDISSAAVIILAGLVALRWIILGIGAVLLLRPVSSCPACFGPTFILDRRWLRRVAPWLEWRWCARCGWQGPARRLAERPAGGSRPRAELGDDPAGRPHRSSP